MSPYSFRALASDISLKGVPLTFDPPEICSALFGTRLPEHPHICSLMFLRSSGHRSAIYNQNMTPAGLLSGRRRDANIPKLSMGPRRWGLQAARGGAWRKAGEPGSTSGQVRYSCSHMYTMYRYSYRCSLCICMYSYSYSYSYSYKHSYSYSYGYSYSYMWRGGGDALAHGKRWSHVVCMCNIVCTIDHAMNIMHTCNLTYYFYYVYIVSTYDVFVMP